jgi:DnaK suppressor protein
MTHTEIEPFRTMLNAREEQLLPQLRRREGIAIEKTPDALDEVHIAAERELVTRNLERESILLREVRAALSRIEEGVFGECLKCEQEIGLKRLNAVPWAPLCISCQQAEDENHGRRLNELARALPRAA